MEVIQELHDAVSKACEASFDSAYQQMRSQLEAQAKEAEVKDSAAVQAHRTAETRIEELRQEITLLRSELKQNEVDPRDLELPERLTHLEAEFDPKNLWEGDQHDNHLSTRKSRKIFEAKYNALYTSLQAFNEAWNRLKRQTLRHKQKLQQWDQQLNRDEFTLLLNGQKVKYRRMPSVDQDVDKKHLESTKSSSRKRFREEDPELPAKALKPSPRSTHDYVESTINEDDSRMANHSLTSEPASTQSSSPVLQVETDSSDTLHPLPNFDRQQKRQTPLPTLPNNTQSHSQRMNVGPKRPAHIKDEIMSSSPIRSVNFSEYPFVGTQDLDEIEDTIQTPMKRRSYRDAHAGNTQGSERSIDHAHQSEKIPPSQPAYKQPAVLQQIDGNARRIIVSDQRSSTKRLEDVKARGIPALAEDGDCVTPVRQPLRAGSGVNHGPSQEKAPSVLVQRRLENLLEGLTPSRSPLRSSKKMLGPDPTRTDDPPQMDHTSPRISSQMASEIDPDDEPYRARSLGCLGLGHFKINPARNQGLDFAYGTVVRKKDDRKCISGCTRPGCCGDRFRAMARLGGLPGKSGTEQEQADEEALREFVGEDTQLLQNLSGQERENLLVEARARALANQYGRHRHTHQRAQSPPGFWRTDMPNTQEEESDREAAKRLEREKVEERYREAMRPGGLWIFADE
jgi:hypothetical protein